MTADNPAAPDGAAGPYFEMLAEARFAGAELSGDALDAFFETGRADIAHTLWLLDRHFSRSGRFAHILDFGCGVGRHLPALLPLAERVSGVDVASPHLKRARRHAKGAQLSTDLPDGPFDWINALLVFQQILPMRGLDLLDQLLHRAAPDAVLSLQFMVRLGPDAPTGLFAYALPDVFARLGHHGFTRSVTEHLPGDHQGIRLVSARGAWAG